MKTAPPGFLLKSGSSSRWPIEGKGLVKRAVPIVNRLSVMVDESDIRVLEWSYALGRKARIKKWASFPAGGEWDGGELRDRLKAAGLKAKRVRAGIAGRRLITRIIKVPAMEERDLAGHLEMEAENYLLVDMEEYQYDYRVLKRFEEEGRQYLSVLLAGLPRTLAERWYGVLRSAGLTVEFIDIYPNALSRLFERVKDLDAAVLDVGKNSTHLTIFEKGALFLYTSLDGGYNPESGSSLERIFNDARAYLDFFSSRHHGREVDEVYLVGELALHREARQVAAGILGRDVTGDIPPWCYTLVLPGVARELLPAYAANLGLIVRGMKF